MTKPPIHNFIITSMKYSSSDCIEFWKSEKEKYKQIEMPTISSQEQGLANLHTLIRALVNTKQVIMQSLGLK